METGNETRSKASSLQLRIEESVLHSLAFDEMKRNLKMVVIEKKMVDLGCNDQCFLSKNLNSNLRSLVNCVLLREEVYRAYACVCHCL